MCTCIYTIIINSYRLSANGNTFFIDNYLLIFVFVYNNLTFNISYALSCSNIYGFIVQIFQISTSQGTIKCFCNHLISSIFCIRIGNAITCKSGRFICFAGKQTIKSLTFVFSKFFNISFSINIRKTVIYFGVKFIEAISKVRFVVTYSTSQSFNCSCIIRNTTFQCSFICCFQVIAFD